MAPEQKFMFNVAVMEDVAHVLPDAVQQSIIHDIPAPIVIQKADANLNNGKKEVVFVDTSISDYKTLEASIGTGIEIVEINSSNSGLAQIAKWAESQNGFDAIHIFSHGADGTVNLGTDWINNANLNTTTNQAELAKLGYTLKTGGDILIYGCNVAADAEGLRFIENLASSTGADVAASSNATGAAIHGGDWTLEQSTGSIDVSAISAIKFSGLLTSATFDFESGVAGLNTKTVQQTDSGTGEVLQIVVSNSTTQKWQAATGTAGVAINGSESLSYGLDTDQGLTSMTFTLTSGKFFDLSSFNMSEFNATAETVTLTSSKGSASFSLASGASGQTLNVAGHANAANFQGISSFTLTVGDNTLAASFDDIALTNIVAAGPTVSSVTSSTSNGSYKAGDIIAVQVNFSASVTVSGTPQLTLETGTTDRTLNYVSGSGSSTLLFNYTVQAGDTSADLDYQSTSALSLNGGTINATSGGAAATLTLATPGAANSLGANKAIIIDTTAPTVSGVTSSTANGTYKVGDTVSIQVNFSENVTVAGTPQLTLETGTTDRTIDYASGSGSSSLTFTYTVQAGDNTSDLDFTSTSALALNGGAMTDAAGNNATLTLASPGAANSLGANKAIVIDGIVPTVSGVTSSTANGTYKVGDTVSIQVNFTENVTVIGTPQLTLETGTTDRTINYASGSGSSSLTFTYTVQAGDTSSDLDFASSSALALNSGTIKDAAGNNATLTLASPGAANSLGNNKALVIDGVVPTVTAVSSSTSNGTYTTGDVIAITVSFSEVVNVIGTPQLTLETGTTDRTVNYASGSGTNTLTFNYTVQNGDTSADLDYVATSSLALNGGTIKDAAGNDATLTLASPGAANSLGNNKAIVISTTKELISATYDASTGVLSVTGANMGTGATVAVNKLTLTGQGGATYTLTTGDVTTSSGTAFSVTLNATDQLNINGLLNKNGTSSVGATTYNLAGAADWISGAAADTTGNGVTVSNTQTPTITSATYDASTGILAVTGTNLVKASGATNDITVSKLKLTGEGGSGAAYLLTTSDVEITDATSFSLALNATDKAAVNQILNKNGTSSTGSTTYNLEALDDWNTVIGNTDIADATNAVTVSNVAAPAITSATYNASSGALVITGSGFLKLTGATNDIVANKFTLTGEGGSTYTLTDTASVELTSGTAFTLTLSATDKAALNQIINKNGTSSTNATTYNLAAAEGWAAGSAATHADLTGNGLTASNVAAPTLTSATYDEASGTLVVTGTGFLKLNGATNDIDVSKLKIAGDSTEYTLTSTSVEITSATSFSVTLNANDKTALATRLNKAGTSSTGSVTYNLAGAEDWAAGADAAVNVADLTGNGITVTLTPVAGGGGGGGTTTTPSSDGDSIPDSVEDEAPALSGNNGSGGGSGSNPGVKGDGNGDGIADSKQANVTSLQFEKNDQAVSNPNNVKTFVTLEVNDATATGGGTQSTATLTSVKQQDAPKEKPADLSMPMGLIDFTAKASSTGASDTFKLFVDSTIKANGYWKQNSSKQWVNLASSDYGGKVVTENGKTRFEFKIKDGGEFDNDGKADGVISDPGAIGFRALSSANDSDRDQFPDTLEAANGLKVGTKDNDVFGSSKFFVMQLYRDILFREAEEGGLKYWQNLIDTGARSKTLVASNFLESPEFQAGAGAVARLYFGALNRLPDDAGMDSWMTQVLSGTPVAAIASNFVASSEFTSRFDTQSLESFVDRMYQNVMSRSADANGKAYWVQKLNAGASKGEVVLGFTESPEYQAATAAKVGMTLNYVGLLGRSPEQSGMDFWLAKQAAGTPQIEIIGSFMGTQEYHDRFLP